MYHWLYDRFGWPVVFNWSLLYFDIDEYGWLYLVMSAIGAVAFRETAVYWMHRPPYLGSIINHTGCHTVHHWCYRYNYGNYFTFWDKLCRTYCDPKRLSQKFFATKFADVPPPGLKAADGRRTEIGELG